MDKAKLENITDTIKYHKAQAQSIRDNSDPDFELPLYKVDELRYHDNMAIELQKKIDKHNLKQKENRLHNRKIQKKIDRHQRGINLVKQNAHPKFGCSKQQWVTIEAHQRCINSLKSRLIT